MSSLFQGLDLFFDFLCWRTGQSTTRNWTNDYGVKLSWWSCEILDMAGSGSNLVHNVDSGRMKAFGRAVLRTRMALLKAQRARTADAAWKHIANRF
jgi:hypothetical protein